MKLVLLILVALITSSVAVVSPVLAEDRLPLLQCKIVFSEGSFFGYVPPSIGSTIQFDFTKRYDVKDPLRFDHSGEGSPYIPLPGPLKMSDAAHSATGRLERIRLTAASAKRSNSAKRKVTLDFNNVPGAGKGPDYFRLWIVDEHPSINSVAKADCIASYGEEGNKESRGPAQ